MLGMGRSTLGTILRAMINADDLDAVGGDTINCDVR